MYIYNCTASTTNAVQSKAELCVAEFLSFCM